MKKFIFSLLSIALLGCAATSTTSLLLPIIPGGGQLNEFDPRKIQKLVEETRLSPNYEGDDFKEAWDAFVIPEKGEFETSEAYTQRIEQIKAQQKKTEFKFINFFAKENDDEKFEYDADKQVFRVKICAKSGYVCSSLEESVPDRARTITTLKQEHLYTGDYSATNAMGAIVSVKKYSVDSYKLSIPNKLPIPNYRRLKVAIEAIEVPIPSKEAMLIKDGLSLLYVVTPVMSKKYKESYSPTFSLPIEQVRFTYELTAHLREIWVIHRPSGVVFAAFAVQPSM